MMLSHEAFYGPHHCPVHTGANFYGRYVHRGETELPTCPNHTDETVFLEPSSGAKVDENIATVITIG